MLNLYSQISLPVSTSSAITRSCSDGPRPDGFCTYTRLPITMGAERPPKGTRHSRFVPLRSHEDGRPVSAELPSRFAPRASGQSPSATRRPAPAGVEAGVCANASAHVAHITNATLMVLIIKPRQASCGNEATRCYYDNGQYTVALTV